MNRELPDREIMYQAFMQQDSLFEGIFYVGVKTTGIFCKPTCRARKPKKENIEYFPSTYEALFHGYRPCKICDPLGYQGQVPQWMEKIMAEVTENPAIRLKDSDLKARNIQPSRLRRWFKKKHGLTFHAYLRSLRISQAFGRIKQGESVTQTAFQSGYDSLSGFTDSYKKTVGTSPWHSKYKNVIFVTRIETPLGQMLAGAIDDAICLLEFIDRRRLETQLQRLEQKLEANLMPGYSPVFDQLTKQIDLYFQGKLSQFDVPLVLAGSPFQRKVWQLLRTIPYAETRSYKEQALLLNQEQAVRAVARANGDNRIAIIIPCHRVIGSNGKMVGYGGGIWRKKYLLALEKNKKKDDPDVL